MLLPTFFSMWVLQSGLLVLWLESIEEIPSFDESLCFEEGHLLFSVFLTSILNMMYRFHPNSFLCTRLLWDNVLDFRFTFIEWVISFILFLIWWKLHGAFQNLIRHVTPTTWIMTIFLLCSISCYWFSVFWSTFYLKLHSYSTRENKV